MHLCLFTLTHERRLDSKNHRDLILDLIGLHIYMKSKYSYDSSFLEEVAMLSIRR